MLIFRLVTGTIASIGCLALAVLVFLKGPKKQLNRIFAVSNISLSIWNAVDIVMVLMRHSSYALYVDRLAYLAGVPVIYFFFQLCAGVTETVIRPSVLKILKVFSVLMAFMMLTPWILKGVTVSDDKLIEIPGVLFPLFLAFFFVFLGYGLVLLYRGYKKAVGIKRNQLRYMYVGYFFGFLSGISYFYQVFNPNTIPFFYIPEVLYVSILAYAIIQFRLMDINLAFRYATIYFLFALTLAIPFSLIPIFLDSKLAVVLAIFAAIFFSPGIEKNIISAFRSFVDKLPPFRGRYQFLNNTPGFQRLISSSASVKHWAANLADSVNRLLEVSNAAVFVFDENHQMYMAMSAVGVDFGKMVYASPKESDALVLHLKSTRKIVQKEYVEYEVVETERQSVLNSLSLIKAELCIPFFNGDRLIGFVSVGPKHKRGLNLFRPEHFNLNSITEYLDFAPTSTPAFAYVHRLLCAELGIQKSGDAFKLSALQVAEGFNRLVNRAGWVEKIPRVEHLQLHSEGLSLLDRLKSRTADHVTALMPVEEATLNAAVLAYFYQAELRGYWREDNFNDEDTKALSGLVQGAEGALMVIFVTLAGQMKSVEWAHDLRHPFVKGSFRVLDALLTGKMGPLTPDQYHALAHIQADAKFVESRITDLVSPENSGIIKKKQININDLLRSVGERYRYFAGISGIDFRLVTPPEDVWVQCDAELIQYRVFNNLLDNAMRHTPQGGVVELGVRSIAREPLAHCYVRNVGGAPIPAEALPHLFERGSPSKRPTSGEMGLAGLGLFNVAKVLAVHGGKIDVKSSKEEGTVFEFTLPLAGMGLQPN